MLLMIVIAIFICTLTMILRYSFWRNQCSRLLPGKKPRFFDVLGDAKEFIALDAWHDKSHWQKKLLDVLKRKTEQYGKHHLYCLWITYLPFVVVVKAKAVKELMEKKIIGKNLVYKWLEPVLGTGLLTSEVSKWKPRRKLLTPCFHSDILRGFFPVFNDYSQKLVEILQEETEKEFTCIETTVTLLTLDVICETMFGVKIGALGNDNSQLSDTRQFVSSFNKLMDKFMERMFKIWYWPTWIFKLSKAGKEVEYHSRIVHDFTRNIIREKKKKYSCCERGQDSGKRKALLDLLLDRHMEEGELSEEDIGEEVNTFALAGHETVSTTIAWVLYLVGLHSEVQAKVHEELLKVFGEDTKRPVTDKDIGDLQYLDCVLKETNRLYPAAPWFGRETPTDSTTEICGYILPKGIPCCFLTYYLHRDEEVFPDPEKFDPDRFSPENYQKIPEYAYIPFSAGPRNCIGQRFAMMEIKVVISSILRNFSVESLDPRDKVLPLMFITLHPSVPIRIRIRPREFQHQH